MLGNTSADGVEEAAIVRSVRVERLWNNVWNGQTGRNIRVVVRDAWTHDDWEHSDARSVCLEKVSDNLRLLEAPVGASDECHHHAKRNVLTFSTHGAPPFQEGMHRQQLLDDESRAQHLVVGVVNNGHNHIALRNMRVGSVVP